MIELKVVDRATVSTLTAVTLPDSLSHLMRYTPVNLTFYLATQNSTVQFDDRLKFFIQKLLATWWNEKGYLWFVR